MSEQVQNEQSQAKSGFSTKELIHYLSEKFPACFSLSSEVKPLKKGIFQQLAEALAEDEKVSKTALRQALRIYTNGWRYLAACQVNANRVGLNGEEDGVVTVEEAEHAATALAEAKKAYQEKVAEKNKAQRKEFFKQKARDEQMKKRAEQKKRKADAPKATLESLEALASKFSKK